VREGLQSRVLIELLEGSLLYPRVFPEESEFLFPIAAVPDRKSLEKVFGFEPLQEPLYPLCSEVW
jgi:hypothetical protein